MLVHPQNPVLDIAGGVLTLPNIPINRNYFNPLNPSTVPLLLLDWEGLLRQESQQQQQDVEQQQQEQEQQRLQSAKELGRFFVRLAAAAERLQVVPAGRLFQNVTVTAKFGNETAAETRLLLVRQTRIQEISLQAGPSTLSTFKTMSHFGNRHSHQGLVSFRFLS